MADDSEKTAGKSPALSKLTSELPDVESPPLSPASETWSPPKVQRAHAEIGVIPPARPSSVRPGFRLRARRRHNAMLAASVAAAVMVGIVAGMGMGAVLVAPNQSAPARLAERSAMQHSIETLSSDVASLKAGLAAAEQRASFAAAELKARYAAAEKAAEKQAAAKVVAKSAERLADEPETTGSIPTTAVVTAPPLPAPRPGKAAKVEPLVRDWSIRYIRNGLVYVQGHGEIFLVQPGAPLPGLGPVQDVTRREGRWLVRTPKGLIVTWRDRHYFEQF
jgi:hypothetical protein